MPFLTLPTNNGTNSAMQRRPNKEMLKCDTIL
jgi:hypothetical protein